MLLERFWIPAFGRSGRLAFGTSWTRKRVRRFLSRRSRAGRSSFGKRMWRVRRAGFRMSGRGPNDGAVVDGGVCGGRVENKFVKRIRGLGRVEDIVVETSDRDNSTPQIRG
jgi:hypothetical protein